MMPWKSAFIPLSPLAWGLAVIPSPAAPVAQAAGPVATDIFFFEDWCLFQHELSRERQHTVSALLAALGTDNCAEASRRASTITLLNLQGQALQDLAPLASFPILRELVLSHNNISDLSP
jgi:Leucine-rich repeat (LRR) protein